MQRYMYKTDNATIPIVSGIMVILIVMGAIGTIVTVGLTSVDDFNTQRNSEEVMRDFNYLLDAIEEISESSTGDTKSIKFAPGEGSIQMDNENYDRTIVMYSFDIDYDFSVSGLSTKDNQFILHSTGYEINNARVFRLNDDETMVELNCNFLNTGEIEIILTDSGDIFENKMVIYLYYDNDLKGKIWLFDSNPLIYSKSGSTNSFNVILEKAGMLYDSKGDIQVKRASPIINTNENYIPLHIYQTITQSSFSADLSGYIPNIHISNNGNFVQETIKEVYNLRLQFHGDYAEDWTNYYSDYYDFTLETSYDTDTLYYDLSSSVDGVLLSLTHSIMEIGLK